MAHGKRHATTAQCRLTAFGEGVLHFPYNADLVAEIKDGIPYRFRTYDPTTKEWTIDPAYLDYAISLLVRYFPDADLPARWRDRTASWEPVGSGSDHFRVLHLRETAPIQLIEASYRVLARLHHPDAGGSTEAMQAINGAYAALKARVNA